MTAVCTTLPLALIPALNNMGWNLSNNLHNQRIFAIVTLVAITILNIFGVRLVAIINNTGVLFEILGMVVFAFVLALFHHHQSGAVFFHTGGKSFTAGTFLVAMFMSLFVIYGFDTAGTLAEETRDPRREAPKAIIGSIVGAFIIGGIFLIAMLLAIPNLHTAIAGGWTPPMIIDANFGNAFSTVFLLVVSAAIFVCCLSIMTATVRLCFGMSRDDALPASKQLSWVHPRLHTPIGSCIAIGVLAFIPMLQYAGAGIIAIAATGMIYLSYFIGNVALMRARLRGWPRAKAPFSLGKLGNAAEHPRARVGRRHADQLRLAPGRHQPAAERAPRDAELPLGLAEPQARVLDGGDRDRRGRWDLLRPRPAHQADPRSGARG